MELIRKYEGTEIKLANIDYEIPGIYEDLQKGNVSGVFQLSNQPSKVMQQAPKNFRDLIAINAAIRPGTCDWEEYIARRNGKEWTVYEPRSSYMNETQGLMMYQEQYLLDGHKLAGWDIAFADNNLRKNKDIRNDHALKEKFLQDATSNGHPLEQMELVWDEIVESVAGGLSLAHIKSL